MSENISKLKPKDSNTKAVNNAVRLVSFDPSMTKLEGSSALRAVKYPSDLDAFEFVVTHPTKVDAVKQFAKGLKQIVKRVKITRCAYFGEFKAGTHEEFKELDPGHISNMRVKGFYPVAQKNVVNDLYKQKLLTKEQYVELFKAIRPFPSLDQYFNYKGLIHSLRAIRWTDKEILAGKKLLSNGKVLSLEDALLQEAMIKIDIYVLTDGRYVECTNIFEFVGGDEAKKQDLNHIVPEYTKTMSEAILDYKVQENYYKMARRMFSFAISTKNNKAMEKLNTILNSGLGILNQVVNDIGVLLLMIDKLNAIPKGTIANEIDGFKSRLANVYEYDFVDDALMQKFNTMKLSVDNKVKLKGLLEHMEEYLFDNLNEYTLKALRDNDLYPIPKSFLP
jgi:hypothetical protein